MTEVVHMIFQPTQAIVSMWTNEVPFHGFGLSGTMYWSACCENFFKIDS